ncbi:MAG TPA: XdhC family protein [bacterium]|nr:XdhC family protein [bacterium]
MNSQSHFWTRVHDLLSQGESIALATIVEARGSTPREVGTKMILREGGDSLGTIGGGCGENQVFWEAVEVLQRRGQSRIVEVDLTGEIHQDETAICGGVMNVLVDLWQPQTDLETAQRMAQAEREGSPLSLLTVVDPGEMRDLVRGWKTLADPQEETFARSFSLLEKGEVRSRIVSVARGERSQMIGITPQGETVERGLSHSRSAVKVFVDVLPTIPTLLIVGSGHVAQPLCEVGVMLGFRTVILDDRVKYANRERFPHADQIIVSDFVPALENFPFTKQTYVVLVTRGHNFDEISLRTVIGKPHAYIGMIGSKRRVKGIKQRLEEDGYPRAAIDRVYSPIGLDIGAESPGEIAISVGAELVSVRRRGSGSKISLSQAIQESRHPMHPARHGS